MRTRRGDFFPEAPLIIILSGPFSNEGASYRFAFSFVERESALSKPALVRSMMGVTLSLGLVVGLD